MWDFHIDRWGKTWGLAAVPLFLYDIAIRAWLEDRAATIVQSVGMSGSHNGWLVDIF